MIKDWKKYDFNFVKNKLEKHGYRLLEIEYKNIKTFMKYRCIQRLNKSIKINCNNNQKYKYNCGTRKHILEEAKKAFADRGYELLEKEYKNSATQMEYRCLKHPDKDTKISYTSLKKGHACPYCAGKAKYTIEEAKQIFLEHDFELLEKKYKDVLTPMKYRCLKHPEHIQKKSLHDLLRGAGCPYCSDILNSKLSKKVEEWLSNNNIFHKKEYKFDDCKYKKKLRFDFYLPDYNTCIEADGGQHFKPATFGGISKEKAIENFESTKIRDEIKDRYCKKKKIKLIRIPYFEIKNVAKILNREITKISILT